MTSSEAPLTARRILQVLQHLGLSQAHVAARMASDWQGLVSSHPQTLGCLILVCPRGMPPEVLSPLASRLLVISGEPGRPDETLNQVMLRLPAAVRMTLPAYGNPDPYADIAAERPQPLADAMLTFLAQHDQHQTLPTVALP